MPWVLLHPLTVPVFQDGAGMHPVDSFIADQIAQLRFSRSDAVTCGLDPLGTDKFVELLTNQFRNVSATKATMMIWVKSELVAVIGIGTIKHSPAQARAVAEEAAHAMKRIREYESLGQQLCAHRHINMDYREPALIVRNDGTIMLGTEAGWDALHGYMRRRQSKKDPVCRLPQTMLEALPRSGKTILGKLAITAYLLPGEYETLMPLKAVFLEPVQKVGALTFEQKIAALTVSQRATYNLMVGGYRNKEIASELGVSYNTAIHHVAAVLRRMQCQDRLQLVVIATAHSPKSVLTGPALIGPPVMPALPRPAVKAMG